MYRGDRRPPPDFEFGGPYGRGPPPPRGGGYGGFDDRRLGPLPPPDYGRGPPMPGPAVRSGVVAVQKEPAIDREKVRRACLCAQWKCGKHLLERVLQLRNIGAPSSELLCLYTPQGVRLDARRVTSSRPAPRARRSARCCCACSRAWARTTSWMRLRGGGRSPRTRCRCTPGWTPRCGGCCVLRQCTTACDTAELRTRRSCSLLMEPCKRA